MYTKRTYSIRDLLLWTRFETKVFVLVAAIPVVLYDLLGQGWLHLPWLPIALIGTAVAFIISFQNNATYGRLWEARKIWGGITNVSRSWTIMVNDFLTNDFAERPGSEDELADERRSLVMRHIAWLTALRHAMRKPRPWEHSLQHPTNQEWAAKIGVREHKFSLADEIQEYVQDGEGGVICKASNSAAQILAFQSKHLRRLRTRGFIEDFRHMEMQGMLTTMFDLQGKSERIKNFPYPRQYATLNAAFLWIFILLLPFGVMHEFDRIGQAMLQSYPAVGEHFVWFSVPFSVVVMWVFHAMERIGRVSENPFEGTPNDVPITTMSRGIEIDLRQMLGESPDAIPDPIEAKYGAQT